VTKCCDPQHDNHVHAPVVSTLGAPEERRRHILAHRSALGMAPIVARSACFAKPRVTVCSSPGKFPFEDCERCAGGLRLPSFGVVDQHEMRVRVCGFYIAAALAGCSAPTNPMTDVTAPNPGAAWAIMAPPYDTELLHFMAHEYRGLQRQPLPTPSSRRIAEWLTMRRTWSPQQALRGDLVFAVKGEAPFYEWSQIWGFDSAADCERMKSRLRSHAANVLDSWEKMNPSILFGDAITAERSMRSRCAPVIAVR
jgi:hypothetical protein